MYRIWKLHTGSIYVLKFEACSILKVRCTNTTAKAFSLHSFLLLLIHHFIAIISVELSHIIVYANLTRRSILVSCTLHIWKSSFRFILIWIEVVWYLFNRIRCGWMEWLIDSLLNHLRVVTASTLTWPTHVSTSSHLSSLRSLIRAIYSSNRTMSLTLVWIIYIVVTRQWWLTTRCRLGLLIPIWPHWCFWSIQRILLRCSYVLWRHSKAGIGLHSLVHCSIIDKIALTRILSSSFLSRPRILLKNLTWSTNIPGFSILFKKSLKAIDEAFMIFVAVKYVKYTMNVYILFLYQPIE
jgi:hypothetical protein